MKKNTLLIVFTLFTFVFIWQINKTDSNENLIQQKYKEFAKFDHPDAAAFRDYIMMMDPKTGRIPYEKYPIALQQTKEQQVVHKSTTSLNWIPISSNMGGRTKAITQDPNDVSGKKLWAGSATGGLWYNNNVSDGSSIWHPVSDVWEGLSVSAICFDPIQTQNMYVGTGEYETAITNMYRESSGRGYGIWKSTDGGQTFQLLSSTQDFAYISDIVIKNEAGVAVIYAGVLSGVYRGADYQSTPSDGLYRSVDGGAAWTQVLPDIQGSNVPYSPSDIEITATGKIFIGTKRNRDGQGGACILSSNTGLPGSWSVNSQYQNSILTDSDYNVPGRVQLSSSPSNPNRIYAIIAAQSNSNLLSNFPTTHGKYFLKSDNAGTTWQLKNNPGEGNRNWAYLAWHAFSIKVDPNDENLVYAGGLDVHRTFNGGQTWERLTDWAAMYQGGGIDYVHGDIHDFAYLGNSLDLCIATDGGVFYTAYANADSSGMIFQPANTNYTTLQFYSAAITQSGIESFMGGLQDNGTLLSLGAVFTENDMIMGGDGTFCSFDRDQPSLKITSTYNNSFRFMDFQAGIYDAINLDTGTFITTFDYDSTNNVVWANACDELGNNADIVSRIFGFTSNNSQSIDVNMGTGSSVPFSAVRLAGSDKLLLGTSEGKIYKVNNISSSPLTQNIDHGNLPNAYVSCIQSNIVADTILVTMSNYGVPSVWQTYNGGSIWKNISGNLPDMPVRWAIYHPQNKNAIMLATESGIWATNNANETNVLWVPQNNGFPNVRVDMLDVRQSDHKVLAGTHGRSMFTTIWDETADLIQQDEISFNLYPNPATDFINVEVENTKLFSYKITDLNGRQILDGTTQNKGVINVQSLSKGTYLLQIQTENRMGVKRLIIK